MKVRLAEASEVETVLGLGLQMHAESRFSGLTINIQKTRISVEKLIANPLTSCVLLAQSHDGATVGMLAGFVTDFFFSEALVAQDKVFFVLPAHRGSSAALKLLIAFRRWAENRKAVEICINMSVDIEQAQFDKFMTHMGFKSCGSNYQMPLGVSVSTSASAPKVQHA
jgi:hypothetical protein